MNTRNTLLGACAAAGVGIVLFSAGLHLSGARFQRFTPDGLVDMMATMAEAPASVERGSYSVEDSFSGVEVHTAGGDVRFVRASDGADRVEAPEGATVEVSGGVLTVRQPKQSVMTFGITRDDVTVYLSADAYQTLSVDTASGSTEVPEWLTFSDAAVSTVSGEILLAAQCDALKLSTVSGDVKVRDVRAHSAAISSTSGDVELESLTVDGGMEIKTVSGDVELERCDAGRLTISTTSGEVEGTLLTPKAFSVNTASGKVDVPASVSGAGACDVHTVSGDIELRVLS